MMPPIKKVLAFFDSSQILACCFVDLVSLQCNTLSCAEMSIKYIL